MLVRLKVDLEDFHGQPYPAGSEVEIIVDHNKVAWVRGALHLPVMAHQYDPVVSDEDLEALLRDA